MPIKRLSTTGRAAFPRIGKLRKGGEKGAKGFGADLTYFRFTADKGYEDAAAVFAEIYGDQPQALRVYLPYAEPRRNFDAWQEQWGRGETLIHRCDGETCVKWLEDGKPVTDYEMKQRHPCPGGCKPVGRLEVILPEMWESGYMGLVTMETHSVNDIAHIEAVLAEMYERSDHDKGLQGIAFVLRRKEERIKRATETGMQTMTKWLVKIEPEPEWMLAQLDVARREQLGVTEPDVVAVDDPGDLPVDVETGEILDDDEPEQLYDDEEPEPVVPTAGGWVAWGENAQKAFWAKAREKGLSKNVIHMGFGVESMTEFTGPKEDAWTILRALDYALNKYDIGVAGLSSALGEPVSVTVRQGADFAAIKDTVDAWIEEQVAGGAEIQVQGELA